jgi:hypothetical protein
VEGDEEMMQWQYAASERPSIVRGGLAFTTSQPTAAVVLALCASEAAPRRRVAGSSCQRGEGREAPSAAGTTL